MRCSKRLLSCTCCAWTRDNDDALCVCLFQLEQVQAVVDGVRLLVDMEKALIQGEPIDHLLPSGMNIARTPVE